MKYTRDEAFKASLEYFNGDELASSVFVYNSIFIVV
jgi:hypothetical protein